jgi:hypothetical protein
VKILKGSILSWMAIKEIIYVFQANWMTIILLFYSPIKWTIPQKNKIHLINKWNYVVNKIKKRIHFLQINLIIMINSHLTKVKTKIQKKYLIII